MKQSKFERIRHFFNVDIWDIPEDPAKPIKSFFIRMLKIALHTGSGFFKDECTLKSSALTYYSLLTIFPLLAVAFGIATRFGLEKSLESIILDKLQNQPAIANKIIEFTHSSLGHAKGGVIAGTGILMSIWTVLMLMDCIDTSLSDIWKIKRTGSLSRKFISYLTIMFFCFIFFVASSGISIYALRKLVEANVATGLYDIINPFFKFVFYFVPFALSWLLFAVIYLFAPGTKVTWKSGVIAGIIAGTAYQVVQWTYFHFQIGVSSYGVIYGSFAAFPLFLIWVNFSWNILLAGAEIAYQLQRSFVASKNS